MTERKYLITWTIIYLLNIIVIGGGGIFMTVSYYLSCKHFPVPLCLTAVIAIIGGIIGIIRLNKEWKEVKTNFLKYL